MNISIFLFFFYAVTVVEATKYRIHKKTNGFDQRPNIPESSPLQYYRIAKNFEKKQLLNVLQNPQIPLHVKVNLIQNHNKSSHFAPPVQVDLSTRTPHYFAEDFWYRSNPGITPPNIYAGGLMKEFSFDMDEEN